MTNTTEQAIAELKRITEEGFKRLSNEQAEQARQQQLTTIEMQIIQVESQRRFLEIEIEEMKQMNGVSGLEHQEIIGIKIKLKWELSNTINKLNRKLIDVKHGGITLLK